MKFRRMQFHFLIALLALIIAVVDSNRVENCSDCEDEIDEDDDEEEQIEKPELEESDKQETETEWRPNAFQGFAISVPSLYRLVVEEQYLYRVLKKYLIKHRDDYEDLEKEDIYHGIERYVNYYEADMFHNLDLWQKASDHHISLYATLYHPFLIFFMLRRIVFEMPRVHELLANEPDIENLPYLDADEWPGAEDMARYASLLVLLPYFYDFEMAEFVRGKFHNHRTDIGLLATHAFELTFTARKNRFYATALEFISYAHEKNRKEKSLDIAAIHESYNTTVTQHDENWVPTLTDNFATFTKKIGNVSNYIKNRQSFMTKKKALSTKATKSFVQFSTSKNQDHLLHNYMTVCNGKDMRVQSISFDHLNIAVGNELHCWLEPSHTAIDPFKIELLNSDPYIVQVHDFISSELVSILMTYAFDWLVPPVTSAGDDKEHHVARGIRKAFTMCEVGKEFERQDILRRLDLKIEMVTGFSLRNSDPLSLSATVPGGHEAPHHDTENSNGRQGTFMIYLQDVAVGGNTAFPHLGFSIQPTSRSAVFWHHPDDSIDDRLYHGECPVVLGQKWVATKWIPRHKNSNQCTSLK